MARDIHINNINEFICKLSHDNFEMSPQLGIEVLFFL